jgi:hypothetical protein
MKPSSTAVLTGQFMKEASRNLSPSATPIRNKAPNRGRSAIEEEARQGVGGQAGGNVQRHQGRWTGAVLARVALSQE